MDACRGFSVKVLAITTNTYAANYEFQTINYVSVDTLEEVASSRRSGMCTCCRTPFHCGSSSAGR